MSPFALSDDLKNHLETTLILAGVRPPEGERFCVVSRDDVLRNFGIRSWMLLPEAELRDQLKNVGLSDASIEAKFQHARQNMSTLMCGKRAS